MISLTTRFWYWVYRLSHRLMDYSEKIADARSATETGAAPGTDAYIVWDGKTGCSWTNGESTSSNTNTGNITPMTEQTANQQCLQQPRAQTPNKIPNLPKRKVQVPDKLKDWVNQEEAEINARFKHKE